jgi:hypothetical protein
MRVTRVEMRMLSRRAVVVALLAVAIVAGSSIWFLSDTRHIECEYFHDTGACLGLVAVQSPVDTAYAWFRAIDDGDGPLVMAQFASDAPGRSGWDGPPSDIFQQVRCQLNSETATAATVACSFTVREDWSGFPAGNFSMGVEMVRQPPGPWLIYDYGQG